MTYRIFLEHYLSGVVTLFAMVNPLSTAPLFLALTSSMPEDRQRHVARRAATNAGLILLVCLLIGSLVMQFFGISIPALRVAGGLIIVLMGFRMLFGDMAPSKGGTGAHEGSLDPSFVPLAMPSLSGPGSMSVALTVSTRIAETGSLRTSLLLYLVAVAVILTIALSAFLILRQSRNLVVYLGADGVESMKRVMGFLLVCIGVQFVANGIREFVLQM